MAYVYRHIRLDTNQVFYVGIGRDNPRNKKLYLRARTALGRNDFWKRVVAKAGFDWEILIDEVSPEAAAQKEIEYRGNCVPSEVDTECSNRYLL